ncbi:MAG TPA: SDR family NAD(P)-dependent oxidoreductase [Micromonosporaceae bacterium]|nr:SDR family NAD(P)-dependent oxidoreductase [Micromonosporaceae bacterium]
MRSVIITGVSRGLGAAFFDEFHAAGYRVMALGRRFSVAQHAAERADPLRVRLRQADLAYPASLPSAAEFASFLSGSTDVVLVHNAGVIDPVGAIGTMAPEEIERAVSVNVTAPMLLTNAVLAAGLARGGATDGKPRWRLTVLFISSGAAHRHIGGWSVYGATKRAGEAFVEALAAEHADDDRVRVAVVQPGVMDTGMQERLREYAARDVYFPDRDRYLTLHREGRLADPREVARRVIAENIDVVPA